MEASECVILQLEGSLRRTWVMAFSCLLSMPADESQAAAPGVEASCMHQASTSIARYITAMCTSCSSWCHIMHPLRPGPQHCSTCTPAATQP